MIAADRDDSAVRNRSLKQYEQLGSACADVAHHDPKFALIALQHAVASDEAFVNRVIDLDPGSVCGCHYGLRDSRLRGDHVNLRLELGCEHAIGVTDSALVIEDEFLREQVHDLPV